MAPAAEVVQAAKPPSSPPAFPPVAPNAFTPYFDKLWGYTTLYSNPKNRWLQELRFVGREQVDWYYFHSSSQGSATNFVNRRTRFGFKSKILDTLTLHTEVDINLEGDRKAYNKLTDAYVRWSPDKRFNVTVGKQAAKFTLDGSISSTLLYTIDRSNVATNFWFPEEYMPGVSLSGDVGKWSYNAGYFSSGQANGEFGHFNAGSFFLLSGGYDFSQLLGADKAAARLDYVWQNPNSKNDFTRRDEEDIVSLNTQLEKGRWSLGTDLDWSKGYGQQSNLIGGQIAPAMMFLDSWQVVLRYSGIASSGDNGVRLTRYEDRTVLGRGDSYNEVYVGLNKYFYGQKLKWQTGLEYTSVGDSAHDGGQDHGFGVTTGLRMFW